MQDLLKLAHQNPQLARARAALQNHADDIIDGADMIRLAERELMTPLDQEARRLVSSAAQRVSIVTAVSPRALVDVLFVFVASLRLIRQLARLYGGRPGTLGMIRLMRHVIAHLAITGGMAASDSMIQQMLGHGIAAKLSQRLGEGMLNGLLTARLGLAAIDVTRPLPFTALPRPALADLARTCCASARARGERVPDQLPRHFFVMPGRQSRVSTSMRQCGGLMVRDGARAPPHHEGPARPHPESRALARRLEG